MVNFGNNVVIWNWYGFCWYVSLVFRVGNCKGYVIGVCVCVNMCWVFFCWSRVIVKVLVIVDNVVINVVIVISKVYW